MLDRTTCYENLEQPQKRGRATEAIIRAAFAVHDIPVLLPTHDEPYDLVAEVGGRFHRIRCETAYRKSAGTVAFETASVRPPDNWDGPEGQTGRAEYFAVYDPVNDNRYLIPVSDAATGTMEIRFRGPKNGQRAGIDWAEEYLLEERLEALRWPPS
ncbi:group I intron-associated PD-(D/E)XK endonuclease [Haloterrigena alkaliphila]|uniref:PD(D/E)XK endonuclease domain-containing protein n=1 Tax=Haloterrigena alkaliphila TaxID=2816475 RepID=A0A8A2VHJ1_9EURY|nr:group I intron-associated PD-(D/E)XK endonuclease [Haloterrigena alkaliphila]QSX00992.1 group I intron-associated PD-(D/E)XK endonuclease [Haloterrigena alkaliphila]